AAGRRTPTQSGRTPCHPTAHGCARGARRGHREARASAGRRDRRAGTSAGRWVVHPGRLRLSRRTGHRGLGPPGGDRWFRRPLRDPRRRQPPPSRLPILRQDGRRGLRRRCCSLSRAVQQPRLHRGRGRGRLLGLLPWLRRPHRGCLRNLL
ncbi:MAG: Transcriptional regulator, Fur family, partial [uncultured Nocardioidaceae bacterium]